MAEVMETRDAMSAKLAECFIKVGENRYNFMSLTKFEAKFKLNSSKVNVLGKTGQGSKPAGWSGTWSATAHYNTSIIRNMFLEYKNTGILPRFDITVTNEDKSTSVGRQTMSYLDCIAEEGILSKFDAGSDVLEEDISGTFDDFNMPEEFAMLPGMLQ